MVSFISVYADFAKEEKVSSTSSITSVGCGCFLFTNYNDRFHNPFSSLLLKKVRTLIIRSSIFLRMIVKGWNKNYDIYHSNDLNTLPQGVICAKFKLFNRKKLIYDSHEVQTSRTGYDSKLYGKMESFLLKFVDQMIVENHTRAKYNEDLYGFYPKVVHNYPFDQKKR